MPRQLTAASSLHTLKKEAKRWHRALRHGDEQARARWTRIYPQAPASPTLRDVQRALALEYGCEGWIALTAQLGGKRASGPIRSEEFDSPHPYGRWGSAGPDVWAAMEAARTGDSATLQRLLACDPRLARYEQPLHFAAREGHLDILRVLIGAGAEADAVEVDGETLVTVARDRGHDAAAALLEEARQRSRRTLPVYASADLHDIHVAATANDPAGIQRLLDVEPGVVHLASRKGATPLHSAVVASAHAAIKVLLDRGADIHALHGAGPADADGYPPVDYQPIDLALFSHNGCDISTARLLLDRGAAYDLTIAAAFGDRTWIEATLDADPQRIRKSRPCGKRPLGAAIESGHDDLARLLLDRGADPNWPEDSWAPRGSALHSAARLGKSEMVELLLDRGADPNQHIDSSGNAAFAAKSREIRRLLLARGAVLDCFDLVWLDEDEEVVRRVAADPKEADAGCGGVFAAAAKLHKRNLVVRLLAVGARVPPVVTGCRAYLLEDVEILRLLLESGMDPDLPNWQRATPLHDLCGRDTRGRARLNRVELATILLAAGANLSAKDEEYRSTPLAWAARNNLPDMVEFLLDRGAPTNLPDDEPWATPLAWAMRRGHVPIVRQLRAAGASA